MRHWCSRYSRTGGTGLQGGSDDFMLLSGPTLLTCSYSFTPNNLVRMPELLHKRLGVRQIPEILRCTTACPRQSPAAVTLSRSANRFNDRHKAGIVSSAIDAHANLSFLALSIPRAQILLAGCATNLWRLREGDYVASLPPLARARAPRRPRDSRPGA